MPPFIDITDRRLVLSLLEKLTPGTLPAWGRMTAQEMVEHITETMSYTNGNRIADLVVSPEEAAREKANKVTEEFEIPHGVQGPVAVRSERLQPDLATAISCFMKELDCFYEYFKKEGQTSVHGGFGALNRKEWLLWHGKHLAHHFRQFGLM